jgi:L-alanine-DL-glutamate epimerase-like enolase superfamily enzyme
LSIVNRVVIHEFRYDAPEFGMEPGGFDIVYVPGHTQQLQKFAVVIETEDGSRGEYVGLWGATQMSLGQTIALAPALVGRDALQREKLYDEFKRAHRQYDHMGYGYLDIALWDLAGKRFGVSVSTLLGGWRTKIPAYASTTHGDFSGGLSTPADYADFAEVCYEMGYKAFKMHGWSDGDVDRETATIDALGERVGDRMTLMTDPACHLRTWADTLSVGRACDANGFAWLEDPYRDGGVSAHGHHKLRELIKTPILITEHVRGLEAKADVVLAGGTDILRSDPEYDLGITGAMKIAHLGEALGLDVELHASGPAHRAVISAMRNTNWYEVALVHPNATNPLPKVYACDYSDDLDAVDSQGCFPVPQGPGLGVTYDWEFIDKHRVDTHVFTAD